MAGYRHQMPRVAVSFEEGHDYHGCEAVLRKLTLGEYLELIGIDAATPGLSHIGEQLRRMGDKLISWNLEDETGEPVPATHEAILAQDKDLMIAICEAWLDGMAGVAAPLEQTSPDGEPSLEASIPMDALPSPLAS